MVSLSSSSWSGQADDAPSAPLGAGAEALAIDPRPIACAQKVWTKGACGRAVDHEHVSYDVFLPVLCVPNVASKCRLGVTTTRNEHPLSEKAFFFSFFLSLAVPALRVLERQNAKIVYTRPPGPGPFGRCRCRRQNAKRTRTQGLEDQICAHQDEMTRHAKRTILWLGPQPVILQRPFTRTHPRPYSALCTL